MLIEAIGLLSNHSDSAVEFYQQIFPRSFVKCSGDYHRLEIVPEGKRPNPSRLHRNDRVLYDQTMRVVGIDHGSWKSMFDEILHGEIRRSDCIWNQSCRDELLEAINKEIEFYHSLKGRDLSWDPEEFYPRYSWVDRELRVGKYFVELLLEEQWNVLASTSMKFHDSDSESSSSRRRGSVHEKNATSVLDCRMLKVR